MRTGCILHCLQHAQLAIAPPWAHRTLPRSWLDVSINKLREAGSTVRDQVGIQTADRGRRLMGSPQLSGSVAVAGNTANSDLPS